MTECAPTTSLVPLNAIELAKDSKGHVSFRGLFRPITLSTGTYVVKTSRDVALTWTGKM